ncbi:MAG TPA: protein kinase, partial [Pyrinomonadaceae bacterium]|nr:protein kinase [Pyrinomonadaceae bacterium]
ESFDKQVALKLIKRGMDTNAVLTRFVMERRILAQLQHRFIANLLDGGSTSDGLPYFVMEHVEGLPITKFCDSNELSINERLELFRKVCSAISYAHQNLVVHRDIKPSNIMVTEDGVPKLLDFGIAKLLHPDWSLETNEATATIFRVLTPEYASPEQMRGAQITTTSDVYSLGVVLYELLCGERPFKFEGRMPGEAAQIVLSEEPIRPSSVVSSESKVLTDENNEPPTTNKQLGNPKSKTQNLRSLRGDLDNIILKTLAKEPERRYQSVQELSEDIRRHLVGLPVTATAESMAYRISKFVKRHRTASIAGGAIVLILLAATAVTFWQARVARRERDRADQRFNQVRKLAHTVLFEYHDGIAKLAGSTPIRKKMVSDAVEYLDNLSAENIDDKDLLLELADAYEKVGDVQGNPYHANLGDQDGAVASYRKSLAIRETLVASNPSDAGIKWSAGNSYNDVGDMLWAKSASEDALANYNKALTIFEELSKAEPTVNNNQGIVYSLNGIAHVQAQMNDPASAIETYKRKLTIANAILATAPENNVFRYAVAVSYLKLGDSFSEKGDYKTALEHQNKAIESFSEMAEADKDDLTATRSLAIALANTALSYTELEQY